MRELDFDVLVPRAAGEGEPYLAVVDRPAAHARMDAIIARLEAGADR